MISICNCVHFYLFFVTVDGNYTEWEDVGTCSVTCGGGLIKQRRTCTNPRSQHGGKPCANETEFRDVECNNERCPGSLWVDKF